MAGWELVESSGLLDDADITITGARFGYDATYDDGDTLILIVDGTSNQEGWETFQQFLSIGKGWDTQDQGLTVNGQDAFRTNSQYGIFIAGAVANGAEKVLMARGMPDVAAIWVGLKFHVNRSPHDYGGEIGVKNVLAPTAFLGEVGKADAPVETPVTATPAPATEGAAPTSNGAGKLTEAVTVLAKSADNHDAFLEEVITQHPDVQKDPALFADVVDPDGLYARANA
jgi:hypothetical protein